MLRINKIFLQMVSYSIMGIVAGAILAVIFGFILDIFYDNKDIEFSKVPMVPAAGGAVGGILSAVLVIKINKGTEKE